MYTSVALLALANFYVAPSPSRERPEWLNDYQVAMTRGKIAQRPLAVFVGAGQAGYNQMSREGKLNQAVQKLLADKYVCIYLDANRKEAKDLVGDLGITRGRGLVISDKTGLVQAFHWDGDLPVGELARNLQRFADPNLVVQETESNQPPPAPVYVPAPVMMRNC